ncbi:hypothetical protein F4561_005983 [Lipingzhangella halophila]|uniref:Methylamine utilisation protein MauE domain-containing protein n=1 Tax=Lipingzhangella halophila TaxID=1783352 RepID=A0A7W7RN81_9ACTN|nr:MauE/DoxX family redox-associated membrane protein [Lipingzhangella halophila]MBB4935089.1 hypothetical protein [Lipingzhangella halophila]
MLDAVREIQLPVLALLLLLGAVSKLTGSDTRGGASLLPVRARPWFTRAHGAVEVLVAGALLVLPGQVGDAGRMWAAALFAGGVVALFVLRRRDPEMGCGCFGGLSTTPIGWRVIARAAVFAVAAAATVGVDGSGLGVLGGLTGWHAAVIAAEAALLAALSPELGELTLRLARRERCDTRAVPMRRTLARLLLSDVWRASTAVVTSRRPLDVWRQGCWRFLRYAGRRDGRPVDVVFGVPLDGRRSAVRAAITDAETGATLSVFESRRTVQTPRFRREELRDVAGISTLGR